MHGGSGLSPEQYKECVNRGITKINFATYMLLAGGKGIGDVIAKNAEEGKSNNFLDLYPAGVGAMKDIVMEHIGYFQTKPIA